MTRRTIVGVLCLTATVVLCAGSGTAVAQSQTKARPLAGSRIPESEIASLQAELNNRGRRTSLTSRRRACKNLARKGIALFEKYPAAPNRYRLLGIVLQSQKRLLGMESTDRNRNALFDTCEKLAHAPDEYAELRLEADMLLSEKALTARNADLKDRAEALAELVKRYRDTPAEAKSLKMAAMIAPKLEAFDLEAELFDVLSERFAGDAGVIEFIQKNLGVRRLDVLFSGTFTRVDGKTLRFPIDRMGHLCFMVFWSRKTPGFEAYLKQIKELQAQYPERFDVFSFNLDELSDGGEATLRELGLDWTAMRLPGGPKSEAFRTYAQKSPRGILVNGFGHALLMPMVVSKREFKIRSERISDERYLAQLQSLFIGDFLVIDPEGAFDPTLPPELKMISMCAGKQNQTKLSRTAESVPAEILRDIQACFIPAPFRYRLTRTEALADYRKAEKLCREAAGKYPKAVDLWIVRNRWIVALLGMWNITGDPKHLEDAVRESRIALAATLPSGADVVPRFCLAKTTLRMGETEPESVLSGLIEKTGGPNAPGSAFSAAAILALDAHSLDLHDFYRGRILKAPEDGNPMLWSVTSFLRDRYHTYRLLRANYVRHERSSIYGSLRGYVVAHGAPPPRDRLPKLELKMLDGRALTLPRDTDGRLTLLLLIEPPADKTQMKFPREIVSTMKYAVGLRDHHVRKEVDVVAAFLCEDAERVNALMKANSWTCRAAMVPGALANPMVRRLGIVSADRMANVFVLRRDGAVAWHTSGLRYRAEFGYPFAVYLAMRVHVEVCDVEIAYSALEQKDYRKAARYFATPFVPEGDQRYRWAGPRFHGLSLAHMGLRDWEKALVDIDAALEAHQKGFHDAKTGPCDVMAEMWLIRATILDHLGRKEEAQAERMRAAGVTSSHRAAPYGLFHNRLKVLRREER